MGRLVVSLLVVLTLGAAGCPTSSSGDGGEPAVSPEPSPAASPEPSPAVNVDAGDHAVDDAGAPAVPDAGSSDGGVVDVPDAGLQMVLEPTDADLRWMAALPWVTTEQRSNLLTYLTFNVEAGVVHRWSDDDIRGVLQALLLHVYAYDVGDVVDVRVLVFDGAVAERVFAVDVVEVDLDLCAGQPCATALALDDDDVQWLVDANKGTLTQLDNLLAFGNFNVDDTDPDAWAMTALHDAFAALLFHRHGLAVGLTVDVTYDAYDGTAVAPATLSVTVAALPPFDVHSHAPVPVAKTSSTRVDVHYMPWFASKPYDGYWGSHWTMANRNPDVVDVDGHPQVASHYDPLIGPYSSQDPDAVEHHLLLMKLAGIDGVLIDWYGTYDVYDYAANLAASNALIDRVDDVGLQFAIVYEDRSTENVVAQGRASTAVEAATTDFSYMRDTYFSSSSYTQWSGAPLLLTFTPIHIEAEADWLQVLQDSQTAPHFLSIWWQGGDLGAAGDGEFAWVSSTGHLTTLESFYRDRRPTLPTGWGSAYPGFRSFYAEGGWGDEVGGVVEANGSATLQATLNLASSYDVDAVQLVTWNDFGEGTMLEPTVQFGYSLLETVHAHFGVTSTTTAAMRDVTRLYALRKLHVDDEVAQLKLDQVFFYFVSGQEDRAAALLDAVEAP